MNSHWDDVVLNTIMTVSVLLTAVAVVGLIIVARGWLLLALSVVAGIGYYWHRRLKKEEEA